MRNLRPLLAIADDVTGTSSGVEDDARKTGSARDVVGPEMGVVVDVVDVVDEVGAGAFVSDSVGVIGPPVSGGAIFGTGGGTTIT